MIYTIAHFRFWGIYLVNIVVGMVTFPKERAENEEELGKVSTTLECPRCIPWAQLPSNKPSATQYGHKRQRRQKIRIPSRQDWEFLRSWNKTSNTAKTQECHTSGVCLREDKIPMQILDTTIGDKNITYQVLPNIDSIRTILDNCLCFLCMKENF